MANFALYINSKFNPFSYQEMLAPAQLATEAHQELEKDYGDMDIQSSTIGSLLNEYNDPKAYRRYKDYTDNLKNQADDLAANGLTPKSRKTLLNMKGRYAKDIAPIEKALNKREELVKEQRTQAFRDPTLMFDRDYSTTSVDYLLDNPGASFKAVSGDDLYKKGQEAAAAASTRLMEVLPALSGQYWQIKQGYGADAANKFILDQASIPELNSAVQRIVSQSGVDKNNLGRATDYALSGIMAGMTYNEKYQADRSYVDPAEQARLSMERERLNMQKEQQSWAREQKNEDRLGILLPNGNRLKTLGSGRAIEISPDGSYKPVSFSNSGSATDMSSALSQQAKVKDLPVIVAKTRGKWRIGKEGQDVKGTLMGMTRSNLVSTWGNYSLDEVNESGVPAAISEIPSDAAAKIKEAVKDNNLDLNNYIIMKVKAESNRAGNEYDYVLMPIDQIDTGKFQTNINNEGL